MSKIKLLVLLFLVVVGCASAQVLTPAEIKDPDLRSLQQQYINDLKIVLLLSNQAPSRPDAYRDGSSNGSLWNSWKVSGGAAALVRPDGYVGWMGPRPFPAELEHGVRTALGS